MIDIISPIIELAVILPSMLLAYLPMKQHLRMSKGKIALVCTPIFILLCVAGGILSYLFKIRTIMIILPIILLLGIIYCHTLNITYWKSVSVILAVCGAFSCIGSIANAINFILCPNNSDPWLCLSAGLIYNLFCWLFVILSWYPATHAACDLLENEGIAQTWYVFWILPAAFIALNLFMLPENPNILYQGRIMQGYIVLSLTLLVLLLMFYALFYLMAKSLNRNDRLRQENQFLSMQQTQYEMLCTAIEETRQARHDMRHHFSALSALASRKEWQELENYLTQVKDYIPHTELNLCDNPAVDGVVCHYCLRYKENNIPCSIELDLPYKLPISEMDICLVLSNLLENALEASIRTDTTKQYIKVQAYLHSDNVILITVENAFDGTIKKKNDVFQSSKRRGDGVGIQSVRHIAEKNGGYCSFTLKNNVFYANIMLRGENNSNL